jgi:molybdopterin-guanine dinucleotide biosynthesis protein B
MTAPAPFVVGIAGWKNSGKTTLVERLVQALGARGFRVSTVKHTHHDVTFDKDGTDSARHRDAGAHEVAVVAPSRWAIMAERRDTPEPTLADILARLAPVDIVIVEGFKGEPIKKIEVRRTDQDPGPPLAASDPAVFAIASDHEIRLARVPVLALDDIDGIVKILLAAGALPERKEPTA